MIRPAVFHIAREQRLSALNGPEELARRSLFSKKIRSRETDSGFVRASQRMRPHKTHAANTLIKNPFHAADIGDNRARL